MTSLIEQAAQRLEQLKRAGAVLPDSASENPARLPGGGFLAKPETAVVPPLAAAAPVREEPAVAAEPAVPAFRVELNLEALAVAGLISPSAPRSVLGDQFRVIKRPLLRRAFGKGAEALTHGNLVMVTSALAGEGKTFSAVNLAMSIAAELDHTVMLVDADVLRPSVVSRLGLSEQLDERPGLLDVLAGKADMASAVVRTNLDRLTLLPAGRAHEQATELLASDAMSRMLDEISRRYRDRIIIFDSPPLLQTTEARALAHHMGQIVVVVHAGRTLQGDVQSALATIEACPVRLVLLNQADASTENPYGYGYGYGSSRSVPADSRILEASTS
jgi:protein-tyrosine kinase